MSDEFGNQDVVEQPEVNHRYDNIEEFKNINTKLITPLIVLSATSIIAVFTYFEHYPVGDWFVIVFCSVVIFLIIGLIVEKMIARFLQINYEKLLAEKEEAERLAEEARAAMEAEAGEESEMVENPDFTTNDTFL